jgi:hypothetical protein
LPRYTLAAGKLILQVCNTDARVRNQVAAAPELVSAMGLQFGKTFNVVQAGQTSLEGYYPDTLDDCVRTTAVEPAQRVTAPCSPGDVSFLVFILNVRRAREHTLY